MKSNISLALLVLFFLAACNNTFEVGIEHAPVNSATMTETPVNTPVSTMTAMPVQPTMTFIPASPTALLPAPTILGPTETQPSSTSTPTHQMVQIFLIGLEDNGQTGTLVGCGDSAIPVQVEIPSTQGVLKAAMNALLALKVQHYGQSGLYNALYQSNLQVESVSIKNQKASVYLTGALQMGGECDTPRVQAQLEKTVLQFPTVTAVDIYINEKPLADALSLK